MHVLVVGGGGREHAIVWALSKSPKVTKLSCAPGNAGIAALAGCVPVKATDVEGMVAWARENAVDFVMVAPDDPLALGMVDALEAAGIPCIILWEVPDESVNYIGIDNARSIYTSVKYLIDLGHKRIGFLVGPMTCARRTIDRMEGYKKVLADNGIPFDPELIRSQPPSYLLGKESMRAFLKLQDPPTAVLCVNDYLAIGAIRAITEAGLSVPEDISVCGFDDIDIAAYFNPPLTSIKTPCYEMGQMAANIMISAIESQTPLKVQYLLDTELIVRRTCGRVKEK